MFKKMLKYDIYSKIFSLDTKNKNHSKIKTYKKYKKYNDLISEVLIIELKRLQVNNKQFFLLHYASYIEK
jgi:hypothetical protein